MTQLPKNQSSIIVDGINYVQVELDPETEVRLIRQHCLRIVTEDTESDKVR